MGQKHQSHNNQGYEITLTIRDETMRRIYDLKETPLLEALGQLLSFCLNKLGYRILDIMRAELRSELQENEIQRTNDFKASLATLQKGGAIEKQD